MAIPVGNPNQVSLDDPALSRIVLIASESLADMGKPMSQVTSVIGDLPTALRSTAGTLLGEVLTEWSRDYNTVTASLANMQNKANGMLRTLRAANQETTSAASAGRSPN